MAEALPAGAGTVHVRLAREPLDAGAVAARVRDARHGAVCCFTGHVRDGSAGGPVTGLDYEAYDAMALGEMRRLAEATLAATGAGAIALEHRVGELAVGETSVVVAAGAPHRAAAFDACRRVIEAVKTGVPIWKLERGPAGDIWVEPPATDGGDERRRLTHVAGGRVRMVDVSAKEESARLAVATGQVRCDAMTARLIAAGPAAKGDVLATARIAGVMAAKRTAELIPLCHPLALSDVDVELVVDGSLPGVRIRAAVRCAGRTGVEMEALTAVTVAGLTVIDMAKSADRWMTLEAVGLELKEGGRSGRRERPRADGAAPRLGEEGSRRARQPQPGGRG